MRTLLALLLLVATACLAGTGHTVAALTPRRAPTTPGIDAMTMSGRDMCAKISAAAIALAVASPGGGTIDATRFTGENRCAGSMFANWPRTSPSEGFWATVLLGNVQILTDVTQTIPSRVRLRGTIPYMDVPAGGAYGGAAIRATDRFPAHKPVVALGLVAPSFQIQVDHIAIGCSPPDGAIADGSIGLQNIHSQELTVVDYIVIRGCYIGLQVGDRGGDGQIYQNLVISDTGLSRPSFVCMQFGLPTDNDVSIYQGIGEVSNVACGTDNTAANNVILVDGSHWSFRAIRFEGNVQPGPRVGMNIGSQTNLTTSRILVENMACSGRPGIAPGGSCIKLSSGVRNGITLINIGGGGKGAMLLDDTLRNGCVIPVSWENALGFYTRGTGDRVISSSSHCPKP